MIVGISGMLSAQTSTKAVSGYAIGDAATDFRLMNVDGNRVSLSDYKDAKGFIVIFTCNTCPYAVKYQDRIIALDEKYKTAGYPVIAIQPNDPAAQPKDSFEEMKKRAKEKGFTFPYLMDEGQKIHPQYGRALMAVAQFVAGLTDGNALLIYNKINAKVV